ncbi:hypothetical protein [Pseudomonas sp. NW5]|uniref:DUF4870 family protein n=1 Tax=Pseudomonas sp. NW5 TaxID=2934934 RepID=UPI00201FDFF4|nr:hypothetical protein [Pseudomonas sp. NW5]MCL7461394.1 hypothetical protein [Pseudomonas sp. NW5]
MLTPLQIVWLIYLLQASSYFTGGVTALIGVILAYLNLDGSSPLLGSHLRQQIRWFWWSLLWVVLGTLLSLILVGYLVLLVWFVWSVYRLVKGLHCLNRQQPVD